MELVRESEEKKKCLKFNKGNLISMWIVAFIRFLGAKNLIRAASFQHSLRRINVPSFIIDHPRESVFVYPKVAWGHMTNGDPWSSSACLAQGHFSPHGNSSSNRGLEPL